MKKSIEIMMFLHRQTDEHTHTHIYTHHMGNQDDQWRRQY